MNESTGMNLGYESYQHRIEKKLPVIDLITGSFLTMKLIKNKV